jgi:hypothetical protein
MPEAINQVLIPIVGFLLIFIVFAVFSARRRKKFANVWERQCTDAGFETNNLSPELNEAEKNVLARTRLAQSGPRACGYNLLTFNVARRTIRQRSQILFTYRSRTGDANAAARGFAMMELSKGRTPMIVQKIGTHNFETEKGNDPLDHVTKDKILTNLNAIELGVFNHLSLKSFRLQVEATPQLIVVNSAVQDPEAISCFVEAADAVFRTAWPRCN